MPGAVIVIDQPTGANTMDGAGVPNVARRNGWVGRAVELTCGSANNTELHWSFSGVVGKPRGSNATVTNANQNIQNGPFVPATFTPDLPGTYRIQLVTNKGGPNNVKILVLRVRYDVNGVLLNRGWVLPAPGERQAESNYPTPSGTNESGWMEPLEFIFADILANLGGGGGGVDTLTPTATKTTGYVAQIGDFVFYDPTGGTFTIAFPSAVGNDGARVGFHNVSDSWTKVRLTAADGVDGLGGITLLGPRATLLARAKGDMWHVESRTPPATQSLVLLTGMRPTSAVVGAPEELGGFWYDASKYEWATSATLKVYARAPTGGLLRSVSVSLYDGDAVLQAGPTTIGSGTTSNQQGTELSVNVTPLLTVAGGSGLGWIQLRGWCSAGTAAIGRAELLFS